MKSRRAWFLVLVVLAAATIALKLRLRQSPGDPEWPDNWRPRVVRGVVLADGAPVAGAELVFYGPGQSSPVHAGADGRFEQPWRDYVMASDGKRVATAVSAKGGDTVLRLVRGVGVHGRVVDVHGRPVARAQVFVAPSNGPWTWNAFSGEDGRFECEAMLPEGRPFDLLVTGDGLLPYVERRFRGGDVATVRAFPGLPVRLDVVDPFGHGLEANLSPSLPYAFGTLRIEPASDPSGQLIWVRSRGYLPAQVEVVPHRRSGVILWPQREVSLRVVDSVRKRGVARLHVEVEIHPTKGTWRRKQIVGAAVRSFSLVPGDTGGLYHAHLPACPVFLRLSAPGYADAELTLAAGTAEQRVWMRPLPRAVGGTIEFAGPSELPIIVADATGRWRRIVNGDATVEVPPDTIIQIASLGARAGKWLPKFEIKPLRRGERRRVKLSTLPAVKVALEIKPNVDGFVTVTDVAFKHLTRPQRVRLRAGRVEVWGRPQRVLQIDVSPDTNHFPVSFELEIKRAGDIYWPITLLEAAGLYYTLKDRGGSAVPFARVRLWEPGRGGQLELRRDPRVVFADAGGIARFRGLRAGETALEIGARGFRTRLLSLVRLKEGEMQDGGEIVLEPEGRVTGVLHDYDGKPVVGAWMRVLHPAVRRLFMPGGGERDVYDMVRRSTGTAATGPDGRFSVPDDSPRAPLLACHPTARPDLVPTPLLVDGDHRLTGVAYVELDAPGSIAGVYQLMPGGRAVLIAVDPAMSLRPLPLALPAGEVSLFVRLLDHRWAAEELKLRRGERVHLSPKWHDPVR